MMDIIDEDAKNSYLEWSTAYKKHCTARCLAKGDEAMAAGNYEKAIELYSAGIGLDSSCHSLFAHRSKANLERTLYAEALHDADKVIELDSSSHLGYEMKHAALHGAQRYDEAIETFKSMLLKLDDALDAQTQKLHQQYISPSDVEDAIRRAIHARLENAPLRFIETSTGRLCSREAQINAFMESTEHKETFSLSMTHLPLQTEPIKEAVAKCFSWVMLSHRWETKEPLLHDIQDRVVYDLDPIGTMVKLQMFCEIARAAGHRWAWSDTCCIDQSNNVELQRSVNSMFVWYRNLALTIVYLSDVPPSVQSGALANNWTPYLNNCSPNHKQSVAIMKELEDSTGIDAQALISFRPGMTGAREKLQWASARATTLQEDIAYSLFGIFGVHLPVIYGETRQNALGWLLQTIVTQSGDITALDWVGKPSQFNSILPAEISSYKAPPCTSPSLSAHQIQMSVSLLQNATIVEQVLTLYNWLANLSPPRFADRRLQLPCITFSVTALRRRRVQDRERCFTYDVKAVGLDDLLITTEDKLRSASQTFLLIRPWNRHDLGLLGDVDDAQSVDDWSESDSQSDESFSRYPGEDGPPFGALLVAQQQGGEYKRIASDHNIIARVKDMVSVGNMMDVRTLEIL
ncbi:hypothetical protein DFH29DRAFT_1071033 [Suillus ampliporus]|nr:hypothetical protein DFH29DRAFT_1071033 [Suillus ampliporus]